ncbi:hypothetical protein [Nonomuraea sp. NPDC049684]|uniref:hypothetical protein n=1 Tax=Nonomuraea sp. NPDC049684 TaxID=3364356 RepID=UPI0037B6B825
MKRLLVADGGDRVVEKLALDCAASRHPAFCRRVHDELTAIDPRLLTRGGLVVATALDPRAQQAAQRAVEARVRPGDAPVAVEAMAAPGSGEIRALSLGFPDESEPRTFPDGSQRRPSTAGPDRPTLTGLTVGGRRYDTVDGATIPGPVWRASMAGALRGTPESRFPEPDEARFGGCRLACPQ